MAATVEAPSGSLRLVQLVRSRAGVSLSECYQCRKCSAGCSVATETDRLPHTIVRLAQLGLEAEVLGSRHIWLCTSCQTCATRCPNEVDLAAVMDALKQIAIEAGVAPAEPAVAEFHRLTLETIRRHGRMHEIGMIARLKMRTGEYTKDMGMGLGMIGRGKLRFLAPRVRDRGSLAALFDRCRPKGGRQ